MNHVVEFLAMDGHGLYVWGSLGMCAAVLVAEMALLRLRRRRMGLQRERWRELCRGRTRLCFCSASWIKRRRGTLARRKKRGPCMQRLALAHSAAAPAPAPPL